MANWKTWFLNIVLPWEGKEFVNDPADSGGPTKLGVTISTWRSMGYDKDKDGDIDVDDLKLITADDSGMIAKKGYWDKWKADQIKTQGIANMLVDWYWGSGYHGIEIPQRVLGVDPDGKVGNITLAAINNYPDQADLFNKIKQARVGFINQIVKDRPKNKRFLKGWMNRINSIKYE